MKQNANYTVIVLDLSNLMDNDKNRMIIGLDTTMPFADANELALLEPCPPIVDGGYCLLTSFEGKPVLKIF